MKCPKCGYLGFETSDRCRNCGYDFSLAVAADTPAELPLRSTDAPAGPLADLQLGSGGQSQADSAPQLDLDRVIGEASPPPVTKTTRTPSGLPLFAGDAADDTPLITAPRPLRAPLSVRRTTPEAPRVRPRTVTPQLVILDDAEDVLQDLPRDDDQPSRAEDAPRTSGFELRPASSGARLLAALVDVVLLAVIDVTVVYLTLALAGLGRESIGVLPVAPLAGFLAILNGGYLVAFVAASGQTIGKMIAGIRVMGDDGRRVDIGGAVLRAIGCGLSLLSAGLGYLPAFVTAHGRALQDRIAGTRVVSARQ